MSIKDNMIGDLRICLDVISGIENRMLSAGQELHQIGEDIKSTNEVVI